MEEEVKNTFMWQAAHSLPNTGSRAMAVLKSYYLQRAAKHAPTSHMRNDIMCKKCKTYWADGRFDLKVLPANRRRKLKQQHTIEKLKKITRNKQQDRLLNKLIAEYNHVAKMKCELCKHVTKFILYKPEKHKTAEITKDPGPIINTANIKKKKSNKEKYAGLDLKVVAAAKDKKEQNSSFKSIAKPTPAPPIPQQKQKAFSTGKKSAPMSNNNILQLANMLKANANIKKPDSDKLKHFLK